MPPTTGTARATLLRILEEWTTYSLEYDRLDDDKLMCIVAEIARQNNLHLPGLRAAIASLAGVSDEG